MKVLNRLRLFTALSATLLLLAPLALPRTRKGDKLLKEGSDAESRKEYEKAIEAYKEFIKVFPEDPEGYYGIGRIYHLQGNYEKYKRRRTNFLE